MFAIVTVIELLTVIFLLFELLYTLYTKGIVISARWCAYYLFCVFFTLPNLVMLLHGRLNIPAYGYQFIVEDWQVEAVFTFFIIFASLSLKRGALKSTKNASVNVQTLKFLKIHIPFSVRMLATFGTIIPIIGVFVSPQPELYLTFAVFQRQDVSGISNAAREWHSSQMNICLFIGMLSATILWYSVQKKHAKKRLILKTYLILVASGIMYFSSKRTLGTLLFLLYLIIDILYKKRKPLMEMILIIGGCIGYFILYQSIVKKTVGGGVSLATEMYIIYFSRILDYRYITFSLLHPEQVKILDYPLQSFVFDIVPFIRRSAWVDKPWPFGVYYTAAWNNVAVENVTYRYTVSWFGEALANLSWFGIPIGIWIYTRMLTVFEDFKNPLVNIFAIFVAMYFMVTHVQSNYVPIIILFLLYIVLERKNKKSSSAIKI